ncbi:MAG: hypothetical protein NC336_07945 [Clostridium sp.]|nr:hypothetical protein [Clostridium sp.]
MTGKTKLTAAALLCLAACSWASAETTLSLKQPGGAAADHTLVAGNGSELRAKDGAALPVRVTRTTEAVADGVTNVTFTVTATAPCWFNLEETFAVEGQPEHQACEFYMPGFWYHHNLRSPEKAPSFHTSDSWMVREDRLSSPLTGVYDPASRRATTVLRLVDPADASDCVLQNLSGDINLTGHTSLGSTGFRNVGGHPELTVAYPYSEAPKRYIRKLTLIPAVRTFEKLLPGESRTIAWQVRTVDAADFSDFVASTWHYTYETLRPAPVETGIDNAAAKEYLASYFETSYVGDKDLKYYASCGMRCDDCLDHGDYQIGFVGRVLLNAFNAQEYGRQTGRDKLVADGEAIYRTTLEHGFTPEGYMIEARNLERGTIEQNLSIRRQSEGLFAALNWLEYERKQGRRHQDWETAVRTNLDLLLGFQNPDGSFPRKFRADGTIVDPTGGSTPSATLPLTMAYKYFNDKRYLESARLTADYLEKEIIDKADYFSSTLDANCEDKEASFYASTALYYLTKVSKGKERARYMDLCRKSAYFCLSWYYTWDVPFAPGQMLGEVGFKSRGWGNVSVENNHIDVYIFEFATVLDELAREYGDNSFSDFSGVIKTSMLQLMPRTDNMFDIALKGYYPEVVQHTAWDYGRNGKGFYNDIFAPGWTVASLWQMLSPDRIDNFFAKK